MSDLDDWWTLHVCPAMDLKLSGNGNRYPKCGEVEYFRERDLATSMKSVVWQKNREQASLSHTMSSASS